MNKEELKQIAEFMHNEYESYAKRVGWKTQKECQTLFDELPPANKEVMLWVSKSVNDKIRTQERERIIEEIEDMVEGYKVEKHRDLISHPESIGEEWEHDDQRWDLLDISADIAQAYNQALTDIATALKEKKDKLKDI